MGQEIISLSTIFEYINNNSNVFQTEMAFSLVQIILIHFYKSLEPFDQCIYICFRRLWTQSLDDWYLLHQFLLCLIHVKLIWRWLDLISGIWKQYSKNFVLVLWCCWCCTIHCIASFKLGFRFKFRIIGLPDEYSFYIVILLSTRKSAERGRLFQIFVNKYMLNRFIYFTFCICYFKR